MKAKVALAAIKKRRYEGTVRAELLDAARSAFEQAFDANEAAARLATG